MKKNNSTFIIVLLIVSLLVAGCSGAAAGTSTDAAATENASGLSEAAKLALGMLSLEETEQAITAEQAEELLTLWQAYQTLGNSETTAKVEMEALVKQIQAALTTEQVEAIEAMSLTSESMAVVMQEFGGQFAPGGTPGAQTTLEAGSGFEGFQGGQGMPEGGFPGGGAGFGGGVPEGGFPGGGGGGMQMDDTMGGIMDAQGTPGATGQNRFNSLSSQVNPMLLRALISMLETKVGTTE